MAGRLAASSAGAVRTRYLRLNVYPSTSGWMLTLQQMETGRPYPRQRATKHVPLGIGEECSWSEAIRAAARHLETLAGDLEH